MVLLDVNVLIAATMSESLGYARARSWLDDAIAREEPLGLPWAVLIGFVRVSTNPRAMTKPLTLEESIRCMERWIELPGATILHPTADHDRHFAAMCRRTQAKGNLVSDAHLAALAFEYDAVVASNDSDFAKFPGVRWINPLAD